jgi:uncharacterized protein
MHRRADGLVVYSASDLTSHLACSFRTRLERAALAGQVERPRRREDALDVLVQRGLEHEARYLAELRGQGIVVTEVTFDREGGAAAVEAAARATEEAMRRGDPAIYQATFLDGGWRAHVDFLVRVDVPSALGAWSYEPHDTKLARSAKASALVQLCVYAERVAAVQQRMPDRVHVVLGGSPARRESFNLAQLAAYVRRARGDLLAGEEGPTPTFPPAVGYPEPVEHCDVCDWWSSCDARRRADDHLSLVAGISTRQRRSLDERGVRTVAALGGLALPVVPPLARTSAVAVERIREQARIQVAGRTADRTISELIPQVEADRGLAALPEPSPGDLFFDIEGDPFALDTGLEYLFGLVEPAVVEDGRPQYHELWAFDRDGERQAFERVMDLVAARRATHPGMHVYHYAAYEPAALKRLAGRHGTREKEMDDFLRAGVFVDLYRVVRQGVRASVESYSIKKLEPLYDFRRAADLREAGACLRQFEAWLELDADARTDRSVLETIAAYNRDDCLSAWRLRDWLEDRRPELAALVNGDVPRPQPPGSDRSEEAEARDARVEALEQALLAGLPDDLEGRSADQQGRWLLAQLLDWHRREAKSEWWEYYRQTDLTNEELVEDPATIGGLEYVGVAGAVARSTIHRFRFPPQEHGFTLGTTARDAATEESLGKPVAVDNIGCTIDFKRGKDRPPPTAKGLVPFSIIPTKAQRESLLRIGDWVAANGMEATGPYQAARDLLARRAPRCGNGGGPLVGPGEDVVQACVRLALAQQEGVLPVQGPPGAGKTFAGARMIVALVKAGRRVGITANSHKVITNLLEGALDAAAEEGVALAVVQKADEDDACRRPGVRIASTNEGAIETFADGGNVLAGTAWLWARPELAGAVDTLFVDEAGQLALANAVAISPAAKSLVLLGDPQQLDQPTKGIHPPGAEASALGHLLAGAPTIAADRGVFLDRTWRLHPTLCAVTSELFYEGRLESRDGLEQQAVDAPAPLDGAGFRMLLVPHAGNQNVSSEEVAAVRALYGRLLAEGTGWIDSQRRRAPLTAKDVLIVAPYNAHVAALAAALPPGARVGTVDKFQGQEAPVVIYSLATSTPEDAPRGMEFLYSLNRLNVATSRARCLAIVVCSPALLGVACKTPRQVMMANALCRVAEVATPLPPSPG